MVGCDLLLLHGGKRLGVEIKRADAPTVTASMWVLSPTSIYPGSRSYPLAERITVMPLADLATDSAAALGLRPRTPP